MSSRVVEGPEKMAVEGEVQHWSWVALWEHQFSVEVAAVPQSLVEVAVHQSWEAPLASPSEADL